MSQKDDDGHDQRRGNNDTDDETATNAAMATKNYPVPSRPVPRITSSLYGIPHKPREMCTGTWLRRYLVHCRPFFVSRSAR